MSAQPSIWLEPVKIRSYDVDFSHHATLETLSRYFLEAAWNHAEVLGFGFSHLARDNKVWVLSRLLVTMDRYPRWGDQVVLKTWPRGTKSIFALRDFEWLDAGGNRLGGGTSAWLVLDGHSRRPQRVEKYLTSVALVSTTATERDPEKLPAATGPSAMPPWLARYTDVDLNHHVNSAKYIGWLLDSYSPEWHQRHTPKLLEVNYVGESHQGELLSLRTEPTGPQEFLHMIFKSDQQETCRARIEWAVR